MCIVCVQMKPINNVPTIPTAMPAVLKALGIASIPVPKELFNKWIKAPVKLQKKNID